MSDERDQQITCAECGNVFPFSAAEQQFYAERGLASPPKRCKACRQARRASQGGGPGGERGPRESRTALRQQSQSAARANPERERLWRRGGLRATRGTCGRIRRWPAARRPGWRGPARAGATGRGGASTAGRAAIRVRTNRPGELAQGRGASGLHARRAPRKTGNERLARPRPRTPSEPSARRALAPSGPVTTLRAPSAAPRLRSRSSRSRGVRSSASPATAREKGRRRPKKPRQTPTRMRASSSRAFAYTSRRNGIDAR